MRILTLTAPVFGACCYLIVADDGDTVVVDAGGGVAPSVARVVEEDRLRITGVLATHGHADHVWDAGRVANAAGVPLTVHARDAYRLDDPLESLGGVRSGVHAALESMGMSATWRPPAGRELIGAGEDGERTADAELVFGSVRLVARHAPGHTEGSTLYLVGEDAVCTGDVLFRGTIGRTDLPGGDTAVMGRTLREVVARLPRDAAVLPGHGPSGTVSEELATNPFLADLAG
ncbi:MBL fold metallo-hydrolase [Cellulomonas denverensis]|uniref:MBL fold metallo-hydrolase n=1 Tax=Cellulomonas denverensis TaxID=264297 RepID=A0A7X6KT73_9CELL|nr:MBL fold metallo-hydrolase [Cellulomonas denverensis]NKY21846.1 MBL fold metallo-hydrolase [Cellulomonas denverensis]